MKTGKSYAADVYATANRALTVYARRWADMRRETCEATEVRKEQSAEVLDLRMSCLDERLGGLRALTDVFVEANGDVVENAVNASNALASLDRCVDVPLLRAVVKPPEDATTRSRVAQLHQHLADLKARFDAGNFRQAREAAPTLVAETRSLGYQPLLAETLNLTGLIAMKASDAVMAEKALFEAYLTAEASRHDEIRATASAFLVFVVGHQLGRFEEAHRWSKLGESLLDRLGGHDLIRAWLYNDLGAVFFDEGKHEDAVRVFQDAVRYKKKALGPDHPDVGASEGNLGIALAQMGRRQEALEHLQKSIAILEMGLGTAHPDLGTQLSNQGEVLNSLGRYEEALKVFGRANEIWERELGSQNPNLADPLTGIGIAYLAKGDAHAALISLERAQGIREAGQSSGSKRGETSFALARAVWESRHDRGRARLLASAAHAAYETGRDKPKVAEIEEWLRSHGLSQVSIRQ